MVTQKMCYLIVVVTQKMCSLIVVLRVLKLFVWPSRVRLKKGEYSLDSNNIAHDRTCNDFKDIVINAAC